VRSWPSPFIPDVPGRGPAVRVHDTGRGEVVTLRPGPVAGLYVCGITPYDATHLGHAATYVTFDVLGRALRDAGHEVRYVQNVTDVDDPLLARAVRDGVDWVHLADRETALFREDMTALSVLAPDHYLGVTESIGLIVEDVEKLVRQGMAYLLEAPGAVPAGGSDVYLDIGQRPGFGDLSGLTRAQMLTLFAERGGDPERTGKRDPLDPLLWRAERADEPSWDGRSLGRGRPGWHIECTALAVHYLGMPFTVQAGGSDLVFPHHEMSAVQGCALTGTRPFADVFVHQAMVGYDGEKMSKSRGNLVLVSNLRAAGVDPMAIRLALLARHYRTEWEWSDAELHRAQQRLAGWRTALSGNGGPPADDVLAGLRERVADDLDTPGALAVVDAWASRSLEHGGDDLGAPGLVARAVDRILGVRV
jgi:L-cysteine:1D-myo-inositol 2-amino-2-deoxy-alpha-D-glucopyranoside ligase